MFDRLKRLLIGAPRDIEDPHIYHRVSLIAFLAWVGLGADGLSSSCYGPEESFKVLGPHAYLAVFLALGVVVTVFVISYAYSRVIEHFPFGGGGYTVSTRLLGPGFGLISGSALLSDYFLTITVSIVSGADALFSFLPQAWHPWKLAVETLLILGLMVLNLRGVKESIQILAPVFLLFIATHAVLIFGTFTAHVGDIPVLAHEIRSGLGTGLAAMGWLGMTGLFLRAFAMGAGTFTGIEAVSNGLQIMREPKVETGKRTMVYMATSLAVTAGGILLGYLIVHARHVEGQTMNSVLAHAFVGGLGLQNALAGRIFVITTLSAEAALLVIAAQTGFVDGPRVMANMSNDSWLPHRFGMLSNRLTVQHGIIVMTAASLLLLWHTRGNITTLVVMYSINVFITFCLTESSMIRFWFHGRAHHDDWKKKISVHITGFVICLSMLILNLVMKFTEGGWETMAITCTIIALCVWIRRHYDTVRRSLHRLDEILTKLPAGAHAAEAPPLDPKAPTAVLMVGGYGGLGIHSLMAIQRLFPNYFKNFIFISIGVIDSASFKGVQAVEDMRRETERNLQQYAALARSWGLAADYRASISTEVLDEAETLCTELSREYPRTVVFAGKLIFQQEQWYQKILHNDTAFQLQRRLQFSGLNAMVLPVRVLAPSPA